MEKALLLLSQVVTLGMTDVGSTVFLGKRKL